VTDNLKEFRVPVLILSGGEPLLRPDIFEIAKRHLHQLELAQVLEELGLGLEELVFVAEALAQGEEESVHVVEVRAQGREYLVQNAQGKIRPTESTSKMAELIAQERALVGDWAGLVQGELAQEVHY
jgi:organic radical activating enzyme